MYDAAVWPAVLTVSISSQASCQFTPDLFQEPQWYTLQEVAAAAAAAAEAAIVVFCYIKPALKYWHLMSSQASVLKIRLFFSLLFKVERP